MVNPGGTGSPARVISATPAPLPPSRSRMSLFPSSNRYTHFFWVVGRDSGRVRVLTAMRVPPWDQSIYRVKDTNRSPMPERAPNPAVRRAGPAYASRVAVLRVVALGYPAVR